MHPFTFCIYSLTFFLIGQEGSQAADVPMKMKLTNLTLANIQIYLYVDICTKFDKYISVKNFILCCSQSCISEPSTLVNMTKMAMVVKLSLKTMMRMMMMLVVMRMTMVRVLLAGWHHQTDILSLSHAFIPPSISLPLHFLMLSSNVLLWGGGLHTKLAIVISQIRTFSSLLFSDLWWERMRNFTPSHITLLHVFFCACSLPFTL